MKNKFSSIFSTDISSVAKLELYEDLCCKYSSKDRFYHTLLHIENMISDLDSVWIHFVDSIKNTYDDIERAYNNLYLAIWFHDSIFDPKSKENEINSADFTAYELQKLNYSEIDLKIICELILCTIDHRPMKDTVLFKLFLDLDLAIFGKEEDEYYKYSKNIRLEYNFVPDQIYYEKRKNLLNKFLNKDQIFYTTYFQEKYESQARKNITYETKNIVM
jgi:predicted metal-dependent HD superfamily phosphohydrolase